MWCFLCKLPNICILHLFYGQTGRVLSVDVKDSTWSINVNHDNWVDSCIQCHFYIWHIFWLVAYVWWLALLLLCSSVGNSCNHMELFAKTSRLLTDQEQCHFPSLLDFYISTLTIGLIGVFIQNGSFFKSKYYFELVSKVFCDSSH